MFKDKSTLKLIGAIFMVLFYLTLFFMFYMELGFVFEYKISELFAKIEATLLLFGILSFTPFVRNKTQEADEKNNSKTFETLRYIICGLPTLIFIFIMIFKL